MTRMLVDQIRSIDVDYVVGDPVGYLTRDELGEVENLPWPTTSAFRMRHRLGHRRVPAGSADRLCPRKWVAEGFEPSRAKGEA